MDWTNRLINIQNKLKAQLHAKKIDDLEYLYTLIQKFDKDNSGSLTKDEFEKFLSNLGVFYTTQELRVIYDTYDKNKDQNINYAEFFQLIRTSMSEKRLAVVKHAFQFLDTTQSGKLPLQYLFLKYNAASHPRVRTRQRTEAEVLNGFQNAVSKRSADGVNLTEGEFVEYYADVNSTLPHQKEEYFVDIVLSTWGITSSIDYVSTERLTELEGIIYEKIRQKTFTKEDEAKTVQRAFKYFDILDLGVIDFQQFGAALNKFGCQFSEQELSALFSKYDVDKSGKICYQEFCNMFALMGSGNNPNVNPVFEIFRSPPTDTLKRIRESLIGKGIFGYRGLTTAFYTADKNKSGSLDRTEFIWVMKEAAISLTKTEFDNLFRFFDKNCDDQISLAEFMSVIRPPLNEKRYQVVLAAYDQIDAEQKGAVAVESLQNFFNLQVGERYLSKKIDPKKEWYNAFDSINRDGKVSQREFLEFYTDLSAEIENCDEFIKLVAESWNL